MLPFKEVAIADRNSEYRGVPPIELMENAGKGLAEEIMKRFPDRGVTFFCGTGNNGGDGYVAARYISEEIGKENVTVFLIKGKENVRSDIARKNLGKLECEIVEDMDWDELDDDILVDGLLGTGIKGRIREPYRSVMENINKKGNPVVSIDVPSGLGADMQVHPELTVTFHDTKIGMTEEKCGEIVIKDIGIPEKAIDYTGPGEMLLYPTPEDDSHKGENGSVLIIGGGPYTGAPALAGKAAYRSGADLVHLCVPEEIKDIEAGYSPNFLVQPFDHDSLREENVESVKETIEELDVDSVLIGPGLGDEESTIKAVRELLRDLGRPTVIDADALKALKDNEIRFDNPTVLTPHKGEFRMIAHPGKLEKRAKEYAKDVSATLVIKGKEDFITDGERQKKNDFGHPSMTVGGTGDTLAGVIACLLSKGLEPYEAGRLGVYLTCRAGEESFKKKSWSIMPEDVSEDISTVFKEELNH